MFPECSLKTAAAAAAAIAAAAAEDEREDNSDDEEASLSVLVVNTIEAQRQQKTKTRPYDRAFHDRVSAAACSVNSTSNAASSSSPRWNAVAASNPWTHAQPPPSARWGSYVNRSRENQQVIMTYYRKAGHSE
jgi:hypothetical protein